MGAAQAGAAVQLSLRSKLEASLAAAKEKAESLQEEIAVQSAELAAARDQAESRSCQLQSLGLELVAAREEAGVRAEQLQRAQVHSVALAEQMEVWHCDSSFCSCLFNLVAF